MMSKCNSFYFVHFLCHFLSETKNDEEFERTIDNQLFIKSSHTLENPPLPYFQSFVNFSLNCTN